MEQPEREPSGASQNRIDCPGHLQAMQRITRELSSTLDMNHMLGVVLGEAVKALDAAAGYILLQDMSTPRYVVKTSEGLMAHDLARLRAVLADGLEAMPALAEVLQRGDAQAIHSNRAEDWGLSGAGPISSATLSPIQYEGAPVGLIALFTEKPDHFGPADLDLMGTLAAYASIAIGNEWRYQEQVRQREALHRRTEQLSHLFRITLDARSDRPLEDLLEDAAYGVQESVGFNIAMFSVVEGAPPVVRRVAAAGLPLKTFQEMKSVTQPAEELKRLFQDRYRIGNHTYFFPHDQKGEWDAGVSAQAQQQAEESLSVREWRPDDMLLVPLWGKDQQLLGVLSVDDPRDRLRPDAATVATIEVFAGQSAIAIENRRLFEMEQRRAEMAEAILKAGQSLGSSLQPGRIAQTAAQEVTRLFRCDQSSVILFDAERQFGHIAAQHQADSSRAPVPFRVAIADSAIVGKLLAEQSPVSVFDVQTDTLTGGLREILELRGVKSLLMVPLIVREEVIGFIDLDMTRTQRQFTAEEIAQCQLIANQTATAIENARLYDEVWAFSRQLELRVEDRTRELRHERDRVETLYRISSELSTSLDLERVMNQALELLQEAVGSTEGIVLLIDPASDYLMIRAAIGRPVPIPRGGIATELRRGVGLAGWVLEHRQPVIVSDTSQDERWADLPGSTFPPRAALAVPLTAGEDVLGVLFLYHDQLDYFNDGHLTLVSATGTRVASAISNAELYRLITDQAERLGAMLRRQQEETSRNKAILESIADGVLVNDVRGRVILMNAAAERILEARAGTAIGQDVRNFFAAASPEGREQAVYAVNELLENWAEPHLIQNQMEIGKRIISTSLAPVLTERRDLLGLVTVLRDVTREAEADRAKSEFVSTVSHELRTPMTSVKGYTNLLVTGAVGELNQAQQRFLRIIEENADRLTSLIDDLLDISRIETGRVELNLDLLRMDEVVGSVVASLATQVRQRGQFLTVNVPADLPMVMGDRGRLVQVLVNLLGNAMLYTNEAGRIAVTARMIDSTIAIEVSDSGIGISPEDIGKIFDRFYRGESPRVQECQGTGLGLAIVKSFVEMHGGRIWVESQPGVGSTFTFTLPGARHASA